jgi:ceramide glucosyltransferase
MEEHPNLDAVLKVFSPLQGTNLKVAKLVEMERMARHSLLVVSDADVCAPTDLLLNVASQLLVADAGLVHCFYRLEPPGTLAMRCEAVAVNADFWSQALQSSSFRPVDFALGAVMAFQKKDLSSIGGFEALKNCLADDYQIGHRIAGKGRRILFSSIVVECWSETMGWGAVWSHQVRWARTIRVSQPMPYFMSILSNATLWGLACMGQCSEWAVLAGVCVLGLRSVLAVGLQGRLRGGVTGWGWFWIPWLKDIMQIGIWSMAFMGNSIEWRGERMRLERDGTLHPLKSGSR